jgi:CubicO group peptidase (beta-lactamase class C family)
LEQCLKERMQAYHTPALVMALTNRTQLVHLFANGFANLDTRTPVQPDHLFAIGSVGKSFTAIAALQASEAGLLDLHAPVQTYLPWFEVKSAYAPITVHHLLTHSSGLPRGTDCTPDPRSEVLALREQEAGFEPGKHFWYSDAGYKTIGLVLQAVTGQSYADWIREKILEPLEMHNTFAETTSALRPRMAVGYRNLFDDRPSHVCHPLVPAAWVETDSGDGCIVSSGEDMAKYARMLLNGGKGPHGRLLTETNWQKLMRPMIEDEGEMYGYGMYLFDDEDDNRVAGHGGDVPGYEAYLWLDLDNGLATVVLSSQPYPPRSSFLALEFFRSAASGLEPPESPPLPDFTHISNPGDYAGEYHSESCSLQLEAEDHHLMLVCGEERVALEQRAHDSFYTNQPDWDHYPLRFQRSKEGRVEEVSYGPQWFAGPGYQGPMQFETPPEWWAYTGHYRSHNPWATNFRVFIRKDQLILCEPSGDEEILVPLSDGCFRIGEDDYIPERLTFDQVVNGQALRAERSGCPYYRFFTP